MSTVSDRSPAPPAEQLRFDLIDRLRADNIVKCASVEAALRHVPRHLFVPEVSLERAYADDTVWTKSSVDGSPLSMASQPRIVAMMLEQLQAEPGQRVLELGAGTGYNAAVIACLVGDEGHVITMDVDADLVDSAREHLASAGFQNVTTVLGDGAAGHHDGAPYDRIIATVGAWETPTAWLTQLAPGGRLVVPLRIAGGVTRSIVFVRGRHGWHSVDHQMCGFVPLRGGIGDDPRHTIALTPDRDVTLQVYDNDQTVDPDALTGVLDTEPHQTWTAVTYGSMESVEWLYLWLACRLDNALMRMEAAPSAVERGQVTPMFSWGAMATTRDVDLAYLTWRPAPRTSDGTKRSQIGVIGHGPTGDELAQHVAHEINTWNKEYRSRNVRFEISNLPDASDPAQKRITLNRPHHPLDVIWE